MMRKLICVAIIFFMALALAACDDSEPGQVLQPDSSSELAEPEATELDEAARHLEGGSSYPFPGKIAIATFGNEEIYSAAMLMQQKYGENKFAIYHFDWINEGYHSPYATFFEYANALLEEIAADLDITALNL